MTPLVPEDAPRLARIHATAFERPWDAAAFSGLLAQPGVAALGEAGGGFILVRRVLDEAEMLTLAVAPSARRRGVARALVEAAASLTFQAGALTMWLEVAEDNAPALGLYRAAGFTEAGRRLAYYARAGAPPVAAVVMRRAAPPSAAGPGVETA